jgi:hypothetical protein
VTETTVAETMRRETTVAETMRRWAEDTGVITENSTALDQYVLFVQFEMSYTSRYGYDITTYPEQLVTYLNENQATVTEYLRSVINVASEYILESGDAYIFEITAAPTRMPSHTPSSLPSEFPSNLPSLTPSFSPHLTPDPGGLGAGNILSIVLGSFLAVILIVFGSRVLCKKKHNVDDVGKENSSETGNNRDSPQDFENGNGSFNMFEAVPIIETNSADPNHSPSREAPSPEQITHIRISSLQSNVSSDGGDSFSMLPPATGSREQTSVTSPTTPMSTDYSLTTSRSKQASDVGTFMGVNLLMRDDSFSSESNDEGLSRERDMDEFDCYRNEVLEQLRDEVEKSVYDVESMMSLAMTRIFMEAEGAALDLSWVGAEDPASIEASCYFEAYDWKKQNTNTS